MMERHLIQIRTAQNSEIDWINQCYDQVEFVHSIFEKEIIAIAEVDGQKAGLGRLVSVGKDSYELGGMLVFEPFRGKGIAGEIVKFLLGQAPLNCKIYCIPFQHLVPFYEKHGFAPCSEIDQVPEEIVKKFYWCGGKYSNPTSLLKKISCDI
jgi:N-acetylglutamate synthase-like GNAT family acetyltransferase